MSGPPKPRAQVSLVNAARTQTAPTASTFTAAPEASSASTSSRPATSSTARPGAQRASTVVSSEGGSRGTTPAASVAGDGSAIVAPKLKFRPKVPIRRAKPEPEIKPDVGAASLAAPAVRGASAPRGATPRGRGRGGARGGRATTQPTSIAAGVFGGPRPVASSWSSSSGSRYAPPPPPRTFDPEDAEVYSDTEENGTTKKVIDIDQVSHLGESAPTSLYRDRRVNDKKAKVKAKPSRSSIRRTGTSRDTSAMDVDLQGTGVKPEPISPDKINRDLPEQRDDDTMLPEDEIQDRDDRGRRVRMFARTGGNDDDGEDEDDEVNEAQKVDLSESEEEEEEESMEGDFVQAEGEDAPEEKMFLFQFPHLFPKFLANTPVDMTGGEDAKPNVDSKPNTAAQNRRKKALPPPPPEGRIGTMVVMKSGRVKMVMGEDIVMNVNPGVSPSFIQQFVHLDSTTKSTNVLGHVYKQYTVTPDIDRLLGELFINGGQTPADKEAEKARASGKVKMERGLVKMEVD